MKKISLKKISLIVGILFLINAPVFAGSVDIESLIPRPGEDIEPLPPGEEVSETDAETMRRQYEDQYPELKAVGNLPEITIEGAVTVFIKLVLTWSFILCLIALVVSGIYYLISEGEDERTKKAKQIISYLILGMVIIAAAYGIVSGISQLQFF